jgi:hypothetical protein
MATIGSAQARHNRQENVCQQKLQSLRRNIEEHGKRIGAEAMRPGGLVGQQGDALTNVS